MAKALVTGGAGFIGSHIADRLINDGHEVIILDNFSTGKRENVNPKAKLVECDIADYEVIEPHFEGVEVVFHTAALARITPSVKDPLPSHAANATGTLNVLWASKNAAVKKVVYSSTSSIYGDQEIEDYPLSETLEPRPGSAYSAQKYMGELYCKLFNKFYKLDTAILRYFNVYGPRQLTEGAYATVIGIFIKHREQGKPMTIVADAGERRRDYTHISDVVEANIFAWHAQIPRGELFNIGCGKNYSVNEVAAMIGGPTEKIDARPWEYQITLADNSKAKELLGWEPKISFEEGIAELKKIHNLE
ncbi:MAG: hypothetical protein A2751_02995 [Candidatus Doudnabacteria bacterium RIFCSPHIGHO2_01_FULL_46_14]|uniref:NAD-dependent epimerase/dehydratase domain-containing protein n=1 Tax=Candidatus Doudnabacteria bacterium RIFCSPHIGHO2_01_FULL_46_14 TaxID=1817824 RepID=A0A1F5NKP7_9BACT|nr:MAG: hypothetical protein A2751_02995 [Candidatus Doudnabacteria bacterium RIFCSPHIGHO2_01_FULL_46_14]